MVSIIRPTGTIFYSLFNPNSWIGFNGLKYAYSVISAIDKRLPGNTKKWTLVLSWTARGEVGGWGRDPKKCTGRVWRMGSSTI